MKDKNHDAAWFYQIAENLLHATLTKGYTERCEEGTDGNSGGAEKKVSLEDLERLEIFCALKKARYQMLMGQDWIAHTAFQQLRELKLKL